MKYQAAGPDFSGKGPVPQGVAYSELPLVLLGVADTWHLTGKGAKAGGKKRIEQETSKWPFRQRWLNIFLDGSTEIGTKLVLWS